MCNGSVQLLILCFADHSVPRLEDDIKWNDMIFRRQGRSFCFVEWLKCTSSRSFGRKKECEGKKDGKKRRRVRDNLGELQKCCDYVSQFRFSSGQLVSEIVNAGTRSYGFKSQSTCRRRDQFLASTADKIHRDWRWRNEGGAKGRTEPAGKQLAADGPLSEWIGINRCCACSMADDRSAEGQQDGRLRPKEGSCLSVVP